MYEDLVNFILESTNSCIFSLEIKTPNLNGQCFISEIIGHDASRRSHRLSRRQLVDENKRVVCYFTNWAVYRQGSGKFTPQNINPYLCTHLIYAFGGLGKDDTIQPFDKYQDIEKGEGLSCRRGNSVLDEAFVCCSGGLGSIPAIGTEASCKIR